MKAKKISVLILLFVLFFHILSPVWATEAEPVSSTSSTDKIFNSEVGAAVLWEANSETVLYSKNADAKMYPASLTKILTSILILERCDLDEIVTVSESIFDYPQVVDQMLDAEHPLQVGEQRRLEDMLYYMMLESANESCIALAEHVSGSVDAFVTLMNETAASLGCTNSHFMNPHGLHHEDHYTSANDMLTITLYALKNETFRTISNCSSYLLPASNMQEARTLSSTNKLINREMANNPYFYSKASGVKTGFTTPAGRCLISTATNDNLKLVSVLMKAATIEDENGNWDQRNFPETINLFEWGFETFRITTVMSTLYPVAEISVSMAAGAQTVALAPTKEVRVLMRTDYDPDDVILDVKLFSQSVDAPVDSGQILGSVTVSYDGKVLGTSPLASITSVTRSEVTHQARETKAYVKDNWWKWLVGILVLFFVIVVLGLLLLQYYRRQQRKRRIAARRRALELQRRRQEWQLPEK